VVTPEPGRRAFLRGAFLTRAGRAGAARTRRLSGTGLPALRVAHLDIERCLAWRQIPCISCLGHCPDDAIAWDGRKRPSIEHEQCSGCEACVEVCPSQAIEVKCFEAQ